MKFTVEFITLSVYLVAMFESSKSFKMKYVSFINIITVLFRHSPQELFLDSE